MHNLLHRLCSRRPLARGGVVIGLICLILIPTRAGVLAEWAPLFTRVNQPTIVSVQMLNGVMVADTIINGQGPFRMIVDTGCSVSVVSPAVAAAVEAHVPDQETLISAVDSLGATAALQYVALDSVELGGARFEGVVAGVTSLDLQSRIVGQRIDGLLGYSVFSDIYLTLDFPAHRLILSSDFPRDLPAVRSEVAITESSSVPFVALTVQGHSYPMLFDSGANGGIEFNAAEAGALDWKFAPRVANMVGALGGTGRDWAGRLNGTAQLGALEQREPVVALGTGVSRIGTRILQSLVVVLNRAQDRLWLCAASAAPLPSPSRRSVGWSILADQGGWQVAGTIPESPAANLAIAAGDLITRIQDSPASQWTRDQIQEWIETHDSLVAEVDGAQGSRRLELPVWLLVP